MTMRTGVSCWLVTVAILASGCRSTADRDTSLVPELAAPNMSASEAPVAPWETMTFIHKPEFQEGAGPMDAVEVPKFSSTDSGLRYRILRNSSGKKPTADNTVSVHYRGWLNSGKVFDSSYERGEPTTFPLRNVVAGWTEGLQLVGEGGMIELWIPSNLGYGERGSPGSIPPHSHLNFVVELIRVE